MRVLVIGSGSREHAIVWKLSKSKAVSWVGALPGNPLMGEANQIFSDSSAFDFRNIVNLCTQHQIDSVVVGPEGPLAAGISDYLSQKNIPVFGPSQAAAQLECSKSFAKKMMLKANIPTASYSEHLSHQEAHDACEKHLASHRSCVMKYDGLAGGKGVFVIHSHDDLKNAYHFFKLKEISKAPFIVEEFLEGRECSFFSMLGNNRRKLHLGFAVDFKRLKDGDLGPNTGGMGCYSPVPWLPSNAQETVENQIITPLINVMKEHGNPYIGFLYVGLMWGLNGPKVIEFNCRMGDPETQVMVRNQSQDWGEYLEYCIHEGPQPPKDLDDNLFHLGVVLAGDGYPYESSKHQHLYHSKNLKKQTKIFGSGFQKTNGSNNLTTTSGRLLTVSSSNKDPEAARNNAYHAIEKIHHDMPGTKYRSDIHFKFSSIPSPK